MIGPPRTEKPRPGDRLHRGKDRYVILGELQPRRSAFAPCRHRTARHGCETTYVCALGHGVGGLIEPTRDCPTCTDIQA